MLPRGLALLTLAGTAMGVGVLAQQPNPPSGGAGAKHFAYTAEFNDNQVRAYQVDDATGALTPLAGSPYATDRYPSTVAATPSGEFLFVGNAAGNTVSAFRIDQTTGALTEVSGSPFAAGMEPWSAVVNAAGTVLYVANRYGNSVSAFSIGAGGTLQEMGTSPYYDGDGSVGLSPEGVALVPSGKFVFTANAGSRNASVFAVVGGGSLASIATSPYATGVHPSAVAVHPTGAFLFVANWGTNDISVYTINALSGALQAVPDSPFPATDSPQGLAIDPLGRFLYATNNLVNSVTAFAINGATGALEEVAGSPFDSGRGPWGAAVDPTGSYLYVTNAGHATGSRSLWAYRINQTTGALTAVAGNPFVGGGSTRSVVVVRVGGSATTVTGVAPNHGPVAGGTSVTITGTGFQAGAAVHLGGVPATGVTVVSPTSITATTPPHAAAIVSVTVTNPGQSAAEFANAFTYVPPLPAFTDNPLVPRTTRIKAAHITELRQRITELSIRHGLQAPTWTDASLVPGTTPIRRLHLIELRTALNAVYVADGRSAPVWSPATIVAAQTIVTAAQIAQIRTAIADIW